MLQSFISRLEGELPPDLEKEYRLNYLKDDSRQAMISIALLAVALTVFIYNDYIIQGFSDTFFFLLSIRILFLILSIVLLIYLAHVKSRNKYEWLTFAWSLVGIALISLVNYTRPPGYIFHIALDVIVILVVYFGIPNRLLFWIFTTILYSTSIIYLLLSTRAQISEAAIFTSIFSLLLVNIGGLYITRRMNLYKRKQFMISHELDELASNDSLTGILNRRMFIELAEKELSRYKRYQNKFVLLIIDVDMFKYINDTYGHLEGDKVLKQLVQIIRKQVRSTDIFGRIGGDEFGALLIETSLKKVSDFAKRICKACRDSVILTETGKSIQFTISIGMTETGEKEDNLDDIIRRADIALYQAKQAGRDKVVTL
jgi:diguanylate cyclase (GGDEF)-like protein